MRTRAILALAAVLAVSSVVAVCVADEPEMVAEVDWYWGETPPSLTCTIDPPEPTINDIISFYVPFSHFYNQFYSNECYARNAGIALPTLYVGPHGAHLVPEYVPPCWDCICVQWWQPVCGFEGRFGPLDEGEYIFSSLISDPPCEVRFHVSSLKVLEPNGGESLIAGTTHTIRWGDYRSEPNCPGSYWLKLSTDNGQSWMWHLPPMDPNFTLNTCSYDWVVPSIDSNQCLIRIVDVNDPNVSDTSDAPFTMYRCTLRGDMSGDCVVNFVDLAILLEEWLKCGNPFDPNCVQ